ncbi:MAG TPA: PspA/IM30 family protein [Chloroflexia bacterium]|nr:PspA/IM30 family protein [Chloroflexia bacterium]
MGVMERLSTLIRANINDMLDGAEDPEIMLSQILRDMESEINKARSQVADMMAQERLFRDDLKAEQDKARHMEERAEHYVRQGDDTMAKEALKRKSDSDANTQVLQQQLDAQSEMVSRLRSQLDILQEKYQQAMSNRDALLARYRRAKTQQQVTSTMRDLDVTDYSGELSRMERRIRSTEARSIAETELANDASGDMGGAFDDNERNTKIDSDLAALKAKLGMGGSGGSGGSSSGDGGSDTVNLGTRQG